MSKSLAIIENITPASERDLGGVKIQVVEVTFCLDEQNDQSRKATHARFEELDEVWGVSTDTGRVWTQDWSKSMYPVENGTFVATVPADPAWEIGKKFPVLLQNVSQ
jgi:hypothetical protein